MSRRQAVYRRSNWNNLHASKLQLALACWLGLRLQLDRVRLAPRFLQFSVSRRRWLPRLKQVAYKVACSEPRLRWLVLPLD
jgi:hypothetical protein